MEMAALPFRDAELAGDPHGAVDEPVRALDEHDKADDQQQQLDNNLHWDSPLRQKLKNQKRRDFARTEKRAEQSLVISLLSRVPSPGAVVDD